MVHTKRYQKTVNAYPMRNTRNRTRLHNAKLFTDPVTSTLQLTNQLRSLGLYAAPTLGDGNCLFRALADQLWGSPNGHLTLRHDVCDWMEKHKERYEGFVDEDRTFEQHIRCMRVPGTYGGHLELSAFAHLKRLNVKVIQPGLVYVIEWNCGWVGDDDVGEGASTSKVEQHDAESDNDEEAELNDRDKRRLRREKKKLERNKVQVVKEPSKEQLLEELGAVYVAYHDWEHFSSIRNLTGPHTGLPIVVERAERQGWSYEVDGPPPAPARAKSAVKPKSKVKGKGKEKEKAQPPLASAITTTIAPPHDQTPPSDKFTLDDTLLMPTQIPLPPSRSTSPTCSSSLSHPSSSFHTSSFSASGRSPKRTFDESEESADLISTSAVGSGSNKKHKRGSTTVVVMEVDKENDEEEDVEKTPSLSDDDDASSPSSGSESSLSSIPSSPEPESALLTPPPAPLTTTFTQPTPSKRCQAPKSIPAAAAPPPDKPLTRRQRKALGLPHPRTLQIQQQQQQQERSAGKIRIPGTRRGRSAGTASGGVDVVGSGEGEGEDDGEWVRNGTGRMDVRGFRELKI